MTSSQRSPSDELLIFIQKLNEDLIRAGAEGAEQAFGLLVWIGALPLIVTIIILLSFKIINLIMAFILAIFLSLMFLAIAGLTAQHARANTIRQTYVKMIQPQINQAITNFQISITDFYATAKELLPDESPLIQMLINSLETENGEYINE